MKKTISVAMCTFNGEDYILEQLKSIQQQTVLPTELVVSDDGSTDRTVSIVREFAVNAPFVVRIIAHKQPMGTVANFSGAIEACTGLYIALCDQDDVWLPQKLEKSIEAMRRLEQYDSADVPILIHTDMKVTDEDGMVRAGSMMRAQGLCNEPNMDQALRVLLVQNYVTGCTVLFNHRLKQAACPFPPEAVMHDWWLALIAAASGRIGFVDESLVRYRQHGGNQVGAKRYFSLLMIKKVFAFSMIYRKLHLDLQQVKALVRYVPAGTLQGRFIRQYLWLMQQHDWYGIIRAGIHKQGKLKNMLWCIFLFFDDKE